MGRRTSYTPELGELICAEMAKGKSLRDIEREHGIPQSTVSEWGRGKNGSEASFPGQYALASNEQARAEFRQIAVLERRMMEPRTIEETVETDKGLKVVKVANPAWLDPHAGRVVIDSMKWRLSKMLPKEYGDRIGVDHSGTVEFKPSNVMPEHLGTLIDVAAQPDSGDDGTVH